MDADHPAPAPRDLGLVDPVILEVVRSFEHSVNQEMGETILRLSGSPVFVGASDYATACVNDRGEVLSSLCFQLPMAFTISNTVRAAVGVYGDDIHPGDMIWSNDSFTAGGLHPSDNVVVAPVFHEDELVMWVGSVGHITDVGGARVGSFPVERIECYGEAIRFTPIKLYEQGRFRQDILNAFTTNVRIPERVEADLRAMMGANWLGRDRMLRFIERHGIERIRAVHDRILDIGEDETRERIRAIPDGAYAGATYMEHDGGEDLIYPVRCTVRKRGDRLVADFTGSAPQAPGVLNAPIVATRGAVAAALAITVTPELPFTEGVFRPLELEAPEGTVVNAVKPAPISAASVCGTRYATDAILAGLNVALASQPALAHRQSGPWSTWTWSFFQTTNRSGEPWIFVDFLAGGGGASGMPEKDGEPVMGGIQYIDARIPNIEELEMLNPCLVVERGYHPDSGGPGEHRGGVGMRGVMIPHDTDEWVLTSQQNARGAPLYGVSGGHPGGGACIGYLRGGADAIRAAWSRGVFPDWDALMADIELPPARIGGVVLTDHDAYYTHSTGGPGYGDPLQRPPDAVLADVRRGWVSPGRARSAYGVVVVDGELDLEATTRLRDAMRQERFACPIPAATAPEADRP